MKTKNLFGILVLCLGMLSLTSCNKDEEVFSSEAIQQMLFDLKGTYHGTVQVAYYQGSNITELQNVVAVSRDSLRFNMALQPLSELISDKNLSDRLREIGEVSVVAGYEFLQWDSGTISFVLHPKDVNILGEHDTSTDIRIVFSMNYGGDAVTYMNFMMFNMSPLELWVDGKKYDDFPRLVYHFKGEYE